MASPWLRFVAGAFRSLYYHRIRTLPARVAADDIPTLFVSTHRNGAIDGYVAMQQLPRAEFLLASQLKRNAFIRIFFDGVEVVREKDGGDSSSNAESLRRCAALLSEGKPLLIFPEGSSDLGYRHLPFKKGAARIADTFAEQGRPLRVQPLALHYEAGWVWQSDVEILAGKAFEFPGEPLGNEALRARRRNEFQRRIATALEEIGVNAPDSASFANWERLAYAATIGQPRSYALALKFMEAHPQLAAQLGSTLEELIARHRPWCHQGVPLIAPRIGLYALHFLLRAPLVALAVLLNAPPLALAAWAGRRFADGRNVIAFWRFVIGAPAFALWASAWVSCCLVTGKPVLLGAWLLASCAGIGSLYRVRKLAVELANALFRPRMKAELEKLRQQLNECLAHDEP